MTTPKNKCGECSRMHYDKTIRRYVCTMYGTPKSKYCNACNKYNGRKASGSKSSRVKITMHGGFEPTVSSGSRNCLDVYAPCNVTIKANNVTIVPIRMDIDMPDDVCAIVLPSSDIVLNGVPDEFGMLHKMVDVNGVLVDGNLRIVVYNPGDTFVLSKGERIAQIMFAGAPKISISTKR